MNSLAKKTSKIEKSSKAIEVAIGLQVRELRKKTNSSAQKIAKQAGISTALLSRVEHGSVSASLNTLNNIASALGVPFASLFQQISKRNIAAVVKSGSGQEIQRAGSSIGQHYYMLGIPLDGPMQVEPCLITIDRKSKPHTTFQHDGIEMIHILKGAMTYRHSSRSYQLEIGDTFSFDARFPHGPEKFDKLPLHFLSVISYQRG